MQAKEFIKVAEKRIEKAVRSCKTDSRLVIARYTAAISGNFQQWLAITFARDVEANGIVLSNLNCEGQEDHRGMLLGFAKSCNTKPGDADRDHSEYEVQVIFDLLTNKKTRGLHGVALGAVLETTSKIFVPDLEKRARECGCTDFTYIEKHGEADIKHADEFLRALELEMEAGYETPWDIAQHARHAAQQLIIKIFA